MTVTCDPTYPVVGDEVTIAQTITVAATTVTVETPTVTVVSVPSGSAIETGPLVDATGNASVSFTPDVVGEYELSVYPSTEYSAPSTYDGDPGGASYAVVGTADTFSVYVGTTMDLPIVTLIGHNVTLRIKSHNGVVTSAELVDPTSEVAAAASLDSTVLTKLAALETVAVSSIGPDLATKLDELVTKYNTHREDLTYHAASDTFNIFDWTRPYSQDEAVNRLNLLRPVLLSHLRNASASATVWHSVDDTKNTLIVGLAQDLGSAMVLYSDCYRVYEAHRAQIASPAVHGSADSTNTLAAASVLVDLIKTYLAYVAAASPTVPDNYETGRLRLRSLYGFVEAT